VEVRLSLPLNWKIKVSRQTENLFHLLRYHCLTIGKWGVSKMSLLGFVLRTHADSVMLIRIFTSGSCEYRNLFTDPERSFEANIPYFLRFSIDTEVYVGL
jgi:hypothetical protein